MRRKWVFFVAPPAFLLFIALGALAVRALWNWLLPGLFGFPEIGFWQALGILALSRILFGGFGLHGGGSESYYRRRWHALTPEERERILERMRDRTGPRRHGDEPAPG